MNHEKHQTIISPRNYPNSNSVAVRKREIIGGVESFLKSERSMVKESMMTGGKASSMLGG